jgi:hypothetical protein
VCHPKRTLTIIHELPGERKRGFYGAESFFCFLRPSPRAEAVPGEIKTTSTGTLVTPAPPCAGKIDAAQQHRQLRIVELDALLVARGSWQLKAADFQSFVPDAQAIAIPKQDLDAIATTVDEQEQMAGERILLEDVLG